MLNQPRLRFRIRRRQVLEFGQRDNQADDSVGIRAFRAAQG